MPLNYRKEGDEKEEKKKGMKKSAEDIEGYTLQKPQYTFENIVLTEKQSYDIKVAIGYEEYKDLLMNRWGMKKLYPEKRGLFINLYGEPGTGKTMTAHAIAAQLDKKVVLVNYAEIESKYVGETSKNLVKIFTFAVEKDAVLIFDEADALLSKRVTNMTNSTDVSVNQTKSVLLNLLNDYQGIVIFTTNFISNYDAAFMRRIPFQIKFDFPDEKQRKSLWEYYLSSDMPYECDIGSLCRNYSGISGSDISNCVLMSALDAAMDQKNIVTENYFKENLEKILKAKRENRTGEYRIVSQREVTEDYAMKQIGGK